MDCILSRSSVDVEGGDYYLGTQHRFLPLSLSNLTSVSLEVVVEAGYGLSTFDFDSLGSFFVLKSCTVAHCSNHFAASVSHDCFEASKNSRRVYFDSYWETRVPLTTDFLNHTDCPFPLEESCQPPRSANKAVV